MRSLVICIGVGSQKGRALWWYFTIYIIKLNNTFVYIMLLCCRIIDTESDGGSLRCRLTNNASTAGKGRMICKQRLARTKKTRRCRSKISTSHKDKATARRKLTAQPFSVRNSALLDQDDGKDNVTHEKGKKQFRPLIHTGTSSSLATALMESAEGKELRQESGEKEEGHKHRQLLTFTGFERKRNAETVKQLLPMPHLSSNSLWRNEMRNLTALHTLPHLQMKSFFPPNVLAHAQGNTCLEQQLVSGRQKQLSTLSILPQKLLMLGESPLFDGGVANSVSFVPPLSVASPADSNCSSHSLTKAGTPVLEAEATNKLTHEESSSILKNDANCRDEAHCKVYSSCKTLDRVNDEKSTKSAKENLKRQHRKLLTENEEKDEMRDSFPENNPRNKGRRRRKRPKLETGKLQQSTRKRHAIGSPTNRESEDDNALLEEALWISKLQHATGKVSRGYGVPDLFYCPRPSRSRGNIIDNQDVSLKVDDIVWAKLVDRPWWPAKILSFIKCETGSKQTMPFVSVQWLGRPPSFTDVLPSSLILPFAVNFREHFLPHKKSNIYVRAIEEALDSTGLDPIRCIDPLIVGQTEVCTN